MEQKKVLIIGATGLVGYAAMKYFSLQKDYHVIAVSRGKPAELFRSEYLSVDLTDKIQCKDVFGKLRNVTHVVYTAVYEKPNLVKGWNDEEQISINKLMFQNFFEPLERVSQKLKHITLMQGAKAYGAHVRKIKNPAREGISEMRTQPNFYWEQEDYIKEKQKGKNWSWTIFRPTIIFGESIGSAMNIIPVIGVYASFLKEQGKPLYYLGGIETILSATDVELLASAIYWAAESENASNEIFNITNGNVFVWSSVWPMIAKTLGMEPGKRIETSLTEEIPKQENNWDYIREKYNLLVPNFKKFVGYSLSYADYLFFYGSTKMPYPFFLSDIKLRKAGFHEWIDTEMMFKKWFRLFREKRMLP